MNSIRVGLVGVSGYGRVHFTHLKALAEQGHLEFAAAAVINPEQVPEELSELRRLGAKVYPTADEMFAAGGLDLVCLPIGIGFHEQMTCQALSMGANVLVEKPAAGCMASVDRMMAAEASSGGHFVAVGFQHVYAPEIHYLKRYLAAGRLGEIRRIICMGSWPRSDAYYSRNNWAGMLADSQGNPVRDSPINNAFAHYLNLELFLGGSTFECSAHATSVEGRLYRARKSIETFDTCALRFRTAGNVEILTLLTHASSFLFNPVICVEAEDGQVTWRLDGTWDIRSNDGTLLESGTLEAPHAKMFGDVLRKAEGESAFCCPLSVAAEHVNCIELLTNQLTPIELHEDVTRDSESGQMQVRGIDEAFAQCLKRRCLPDDLGMAWK